MKLHSSAKINLNLTIDNNIVNGLHTISTLMIPINLFDEKDLNELLYTRTDTQYSGLTVGTTIVDAENEFYRRLLVNLSYIYKSKGTRSSIEFFLKFLGAPEPLIKIDEYVYNIVSLPKSFNIDSEIRSVIMGDKTDLIISGFTPSTYSYSTGTTLASTTYTREEYPVTTDGLPRGYSSVTNNNFFQQGSGWYDMTLDHRSSTTLDIENSTTTGRTKTIKTKNKPYTYGEEYFDIFRSLPGLDTGFEIVSKVDNNQKQIVNNNSTLILNRKNISVYLSSANVMDFDIYRKSRDLELSFGSNTLLPQTGYTFAEYVDRMLHDQIRNSHVIKYKKNYITLEDIHQDYITNSNFTPYNFPSVNEFVNKIGPYWTQVLDQVIPSTTLWTGGNLIQNGIFGRPKYSYRFGCKPKEIIENVYPKPITSGYQPFQDEIEELDKHVEEVSKL